ncbi:MAG: NAD-dependent epimerase/dehydratase family protein [Saprospiraceae bacterium]
MPEKKILVTGATGFIGAYLLNYLVQKGESNIRALKRPNSPMDLVNHIQDKIEWVEGDILDTTCLEDAMQGVSKVYHCAAIVSFNQADVQQMIRTNQEGTANVVNISLAMDVEKLLHVSSIAAIGRRKNETIINENTKWQGDKWNSPYGISKHLAEMEIWRGVAEGLNTVIVNPSNVLGSGFWKDRTTTGQFFYKIWKGMPFYPMGGTGFVDVRDVVRFMFQLMESDIHSQRYILNGENLPYKDVLFGIANSLNVRKPHIEVTPFIREVAWRASWILSKITGKAPFITKQTARYSARSFFYENEKSLAAFPFSYTPIQQTLKETGEQFLKSVDNGFQPAMLPFH